MVMVDPFLGIGHAAVAAKNCGVAKFVGFEIDDGYLETARGLVARRQSDTGGPAKQRPQHNGA